MRDFAAEAVADDVDMLAVLGGDGAVHIAVQACAGTSTALGLVPVGTGNDLARAMGVASDPTMAARGVARWLAQGHVRQIDLGRVVGGDWFATVLCAGFDSAVNARANRMRWPRGKRRYDLAILRELVGLQAMPLRVETESAVHELSAAMVAVGNTSWYGGGVPVCPDANPSDGEFDLTILGEVTRPDLLRIFANARTGKHVDHPAVQTLRARSVRLGGDNGWFAHADGEPQARLPVSIRCEPAALRVLAP